MAGGRFSVMRVMPCAVSTWTCLKLWALDGGEDVLVVRVVELLGHARQAPFWAASGPRSGDKPRALPQFIAAASVARRAAPAAHGRRRAARARRRAARRRGRGGRRSRAGRSSRRARTAAPGATSEYVRTSGSDQLARAATSRPVEARPPSAARSASSRFVDEVAEAVHVEDRPLPAPGDARSTAASARRTGSGDRAGPTSSSGRPRARRAGGRAEEVAAVEDRRDAARERAAGSRGGGRAPRGGRRARSVKQAVVGADEEPAAGARRRRAGAREPTPGSTTATKTVPPGKCRYDGVEGERPRGHVVGRAPRGATSTSVASGQTREDRALHGPDVGVLRGRSP